MGQICTASRRNTVEPTPLQRNEQQLQNVIETMTPVKCLKVIKQSPQYFGLIQGFNMRFDANNCEVIYLPTDNREVIDALTEILHNPHYLNNFSIKGGGHCFENFVFNENIHAIIDLSLMRKVSEVSESEHIYSAEAGGSIWSLVEELYRKFGLVIPSGSCYSVGLGGHICGGGYGLLSRKFGLTIDYLCGVDIVCVNEENKVEMRSARSDSASSSDQDLLWACKGGGGGNFGIITCYYFQNLPKAPQYAYLETLSVDWTGLTLDKFIILLKLFWGLVNNELPFFCILNLMHISAGEIPIIFQSVFDSNELYFADNFRAFTQGLKENGIQLKSSTIPAVFHPSTKGILNIAQELTWFEAAQTLNYSGSNQCGKSKSSYMRKPFPNDQCESLYRFLSMDNKGLADLAARFPNSDIQNFEDFVNDLATNDFIDMKQSLVQVDSYGVKINTVSPDATAIPHRDSVMKLQYQTYWKRDPVPKVEEARPVEALNLFQDWVHLLWINRMFREVYKETGGVPDPYYVTPVATAEGGATKGEPDSLSLDRSKALPADRIVDGCYYNYIDTEMMYTIGQEYCVSKSGAEEAVLRLYFEDNLERLVTAKNASDPLNIFKHTLSIPTTLSQNRPAQ